MQHQSTEAADMPAGPTGQDRLAEIDDLMRTRRDEDQESADRAAQVLADRSEFSDEFVRVCQVQVRPAMEAVIERLRRNGGGGVIEERAENLARSQAHRLTLWMPFSGEIVGTPRPDRHPYLQLDANVAKRAVTVSEETCGKVAEGVAAAKLANGSYRRSPPPR